MSKLILDLLIGVWILFRLIRTISIIRIIFFT